MIVVGHSLHTLLTMRASLPASGVKGLLRYARPHAPSAFTPVVLSEMKGRRIAIDATLLTQRFFYRSGASDASVLVAFYNTLMQLRDAGVYPILVFDNTTARLALKEYEQLKRRASRSLIQARMELEEARLARIDKLLALHAQAMLLPHDTRATICALLDQWDSMQHAERNLPLPSPSRRRKKLDQLLQDGYECDMRTDFSADDEWLDTSTLPSDDSWHLVYQIHALRQECTASLPADLPVRLSLAQLALARTEYAAFEAIVLPERAHAMRRFLDVNYGASTAQLIELLRTRTREKRESYAGISRSVSESLYHQAAHMCRLMNVPVFITGDGTEDGGEVHEAEGFASALVLRGYADIVASEDSDVIMYEVPLLRGLGALDKMELIDARALREGLFPSESDSAAHVTASQYRMKQFALICGTDFNRTIPGVGPTRGHALVKEFGDIATLLEKSDKYAPPEGYTKESYATHLAEALSVFENGPNVDEPAAAIGLQREYGRFPEHSRRDVRALLLEYGVSPESLPYSLR